ncbi:MAG: hypothetical protein JST75_10040 [Bacteroidetes bacterium]|nr:hypothetical protein [Bacteroidota bacterium]
MKKIFLLVLIAFAGCSEKRNDFTKIKIGMKTADVVKLVGVPPRKQPMGDSMWWLYTDPDKHMVIINNDTVANCTTQKDAMRIMDDALRTYDSLHKKKNL